MAIAATKAVSYIMPSSINGTPVVMQWVFGDDERTGEPEPRLNIGSDDDKLDAVLSAFGVESTEELAQQELSSNQRRHADEVRFGVIDATGDSITFHSEADLLARVAGINEELAGGLVESEGDIPTLCEHYRQQGAVYLGDLLNDAEASGDEWAAQLRAFCEELSTGEFERRMKDAGVWVEPENTVAGV